VYTGGIENLLGFRKYSVLLKLYRTIVVNCMTHVKYIQ
jgi:hypothetical protein